jgi:hypothetical protein
VSPTLVSLTLVSLTLVSPTLVSLPPLCLSPWCLSHPGEAAHVSVSQQPVVPAPAPLPEVVDVRASQVRQTQGSVTCFTGPMCLFAFGYRRPGQPHPSRGRRQVVRVRGFSTRSKAVWKRARSWRRGEKCKEAV